MKYLVYFTFFFGIILTYLLGRLALYHETQSEKSKNKLFWQKAHSFWRLIFDPEVFPKDQSPLASLPVHEFPPAQQSLRRFRRDAGVDLSHLVGIGTDRNVTPLETKWSLSISHRGAHLSQSYHLETFPPPNGTSGASQIEEASRPVTFIHDSEAESSNQGSLRSGFQRSYPLWQTRNGPGRVQSQEMGAPLLSSPSLFQWDHQGFLAWRTAPGDTHTASGTVELLKAVFVKLPLSVKIVIIRADKGFYDHEII
jgi:hypothetical protein